MELMTSENSRLQEEVMAMKAQVVGDASRAPSYGSSVRLRYRTSPLLGWHEVLGGLC